MPRTPNQLTMPRIGHDVRVPSRLASALTGRATKNKNTASATARQLQESENIMPPTSRISSISESLSRCSLKISDPPLTVGGVSSVLAVELADEVCCPVLSI